MELILNGDVLDRLKELPDESVQCCVTSPPYYNLREYGTASWEGGDPKCSHVEVTAAQAHRTSTLDAAKAGPGNAAFQSKERLFRLKCSVCGAKRKDSQIGLEATPEEYIAKLVGIFREVRRVLRKDGVLWLNLGDSYAGRRMLGVPWRTALALVEDGWRLRRDVIWEKPAVVPESVTDRPTTAHEYIFMLAKESKYFFDTKAVEEPSVISGDEGTRQIRSVWTMTPTPFAGQHFAPFPTTLPKRCIKATTSEKGACVKCGAPWKRLLARIVERTSDTEYVGKNASQADSSAGRRLLKNAASARRAGAAHDVPFRSKKTVGWAPTCECGTDEVRACVVLDIFGGACTTLLAARRLRRSAILIELNLKYCEMGAERVWKDSKLLGRPKIIPMGTKVPSL